MVSNRLVPGGRGQKRFNGALLPSLLFSLTPPLSLLLCALFPQVAKESDEKKIMKMLQAKEQGGDWKKISEAPSDGSDDDQKETEKEKPDLDLDLDLDLNLDLDLGDLDLNLDP